MYKIIGTQTCMFCKMSEDLLVARGLEFTKQTLVTPEEIDAFKTQGYKTVPQIWYQAPGTRGFMHIGGYLLLVEHLSAIPTVSDV